MSEHLLGMSKLGKSCSANAKQRDHIRVDECKLLLESVVETKLDISPGRPK